MQERTDDTLLDTILSAYHLRVRVTDEVSHRGRGADRDGEAPGSRAWFHLVGSGSCWLRVTGEEAPALLKAGDLVVLPRGDAHTLEDTSEDAETSGGASFTTMVSGELIFESATGHPVLEALPAVMITPSAEAGDACRQLATMLLDESRSDGFGARAVMDKLADALFLLSLRHHLSCVQNRRGLFAALANPRLKRAIDAMHSDPGRDWTVASLADVACMSRTVFAERFAETLAETPYQYLTRWRMTQALRFLRDARLSVAQVAGRLGYDTDAAFRRSFKRVHGFGPGWFRRSAGDPDDAGIAFEPRVAPKATRPAPTPMLTSSARRRSPAARPLRREPARPLAVS